MTMKFKALILAGGYGTRLKPITDETPKCLVPIRGKPLLGYWLEHLASIGCRSVLINKHYLSYKVDEYLSTINFPEMNISTVFEKNLLGTAGTLSENIDFFNNTKGLLMHADNICSCNLNGLLKAHEKRKKGTILTMLTFQTKEPSKCGIVKKDNSGVMTGFYEKINNPPGYCANGAIYFFESEFINWFKNNKQNSKDFSKEVLPSLIDRIQTWHTNLPFIDVGTPETLKSANDLIDPFQVGY